MYYQTLLEWKYNQLEVSSFDNKNIIVDIIWSTIMENKLSINSQKQLYEFLEQDILCCNLFLFQFSSSQKMLTFVQKIEIKIKTNKKWFSLFNESDPQHKFNNMLKSIHCRLYKNSKLKNDDKLRWFSIKKKIPFKKDIQWWIYWRLNIW